jgi:predicted metal-binding membrane protein
LVMGIEHGAFCLGCCWILMALLFVGGVMNLLWVAALTVFVLAEKAAPFGRRLGQVSAGLLVLAGAAIIAAGA